MASGDFSHEESGRQRHSFSCWHLRTISVNFAIDWKPGDLAWLCLMWMQLDWMKIYVLVHKKDGFYSTLGFVCFFTWTVFIGYLRQSLSLSSLLQIPLHQLLMLLTHIPRLISRTAVELHQPLLRSHQIMRHHHAFQLFRPHPPEYRFLRVSRPLLNFVSSQDIR